MIRELRKCREVLQSRVVDRETGFPHVKVFDLILKCMAMEVKLVSRSKNTDMFFAGHNSDLNLDPVRMGNIANLRPIEPLLAMNNDVLGGSFVRGDTAARAPEFSLGVRPANNQPELAVDEESVAML